MRNSSIPNAYGISLIVDFEPKARKCSTIARSTTNKDDMVGGVSSLRVDKHGIGGTSGNGPAKPVC